MKGRICHRAGSRRVCAIGAVWAIAVLTALSLSPAFAACSDRPGTPTDIKLTPGKGTIVVEWRDTTRPGEGSCHDIEIKRSSDGDTSKSVTGDVCLSGGTKGDYLVRDLPYSYEYCVRIKARDHAGTEGCVSEQWSATVCDHALPPSGPGVGRISEVMPGIDLPGSDLGENTGGVVTLLGPQPYQECQKLCGRHPRCVAWTYVKSGVQGPNPKCYLKYQVPAPVPSGCCTSGSNVMPGIDLPGKDMGPGSVSGLGVSSYQDCERRCAANHRCVSWTYVKPGVQGPSAFCYLKNDIPHPVRADCCTSGRIR